MNTLKIKLSLSYKFKQLSVPYNSLSVEYLCLNVDRIEMITLNINGNYEEEMHEIDDMSIQSFCKNGAKPFPL